jgi:hypothetical protein
MYTLPFFVAKTSQHTHVNMKVGNDSDILSSYSLYEKDSQPIQCIVIITVNVVNTVWIILEFQWKPTIVKVQLCRVQ